MQRSIKMALAMGLLSGHCLTTHAQFYQDASANLPEPGATGASMDVRAADFDGDGDLDIVLANEFQANTLMFNDGNAVFTNVSFINLPQEVHDSEDVAIADFNADGYLDLVFCSEDDVALGWTQVHEYYFGNANGQFVDAGFPLPDSEANAVVTADLNEDGYPDLVFGNRGPLTLLINQGDGSFVADPNRVPAINRITQDVALADVDADGDLDIFLGNEDGNLLLINQGLGFFQDESAQRLPAGIPLETRKAAFGDIDGDEDLDLFLANLDFPPTPSNRQNRLYRNNGAGFFTDVTSTQLPADSDQTIDAIFEDVDLDGDLDIVVANVFGAPVKIYANNGAGAFSEATEEALGQLYYRDALGVIAADFNADGLRDLYICDRRNPNSPKKDLLLLRVAPTAVSAPQASGGGVRVYPNPARESVYIMAPEGLPDSIALADLGGRIHAVLAPSPAGPQRWRCSLPPTLSAGWYLLSWETPGTGIRAGARIWVEGRP